MSWIESEIIDLASEGVFYTDDHPFSKGSIKIYPLTGRLEDMLCNGTLIKRGLVLQSLLDEVLDIKVSADTVLKCDVDTILLNLRILAYGSNAEYKIKCSSCDSNDEHTLSYAFKSKQVDLSRIKRGKNELEFVIPSTGQIIKYRLPTYKESKILSDLGWLSFIKNQTISISEVDDCFYFYDNEFSIKDNKVFKKHYDDNCPGFHTQFGVECPSCKKVTNTKIDIDTDIFGWSPIQKKELHSEIFNLCYHSNGAFSRDSVYDMPVATRKFYLKSLSDSKIKEKTDSEPSTVDKNIPNRPKVKKD